MLRVVVIGLLVLVALYLCAGVAIYAFQRTLLYFPFKSDATPADVGLPSAEVLKLSTSDGETLTAWFIRRPGKHLVIYFHGNADPLESRGDRLKQLAGFGVSVLAVDYRGYGASTGRPTEAGLHLDADATYDGALRLGFQPDHIILLGESLGSGVSLELASRRPVAGIMLDSPYSSVADVAADRYWMFPVRLLMIDQFRSDLWIRQVHVPILILHGTNDVTIPFRYGRKLADIGGANVTFVEVPGVGHVVFGDARMQDTIRQWLAKFGM